MNERAGSSARRRARGIGHRGGVHRASSSSGVLEPLVDSAERLHVAESAGVRVALGIDFGLARGEPSRDARHRGAPGLDLLPPGCRRLLELAVRKRTHARQQVRIAREARKLHVTCPHLSECRRHRVRLGAGQVERELRLVRALSEQIAGRRLAGLVVDHDAPPVVGPVDAVEASFEREPARLDAALVLGSEDRESAAPFLRLEPFARPLREAPLLDRGEAARQHGRPLAADARNGVLRRLRE